MESHKYHPASSIDDVIQGKGKGLVAVLHGPPGTGKTLTAEGISELLKCPLYMVSAGELGTDPRTLEAELQKILDIAHAWGAVLLLDEADVFLEKRTIQDIHRNALVSIFLRLLEYFQGILFLTTNRVETFDDAFQSRIHIALRYGDLLPRARRQIWKMFLERAGMVEGVETVVFGDGDFDVLARYNLNGRQVCGPPVFAASAFIQSDDGFILRFFGLLCSLFLGFYSYLFLCSLPPFCLALSIQMSSVPHSQFAHAPFLPHAFLFPLYTP